MTARLRLFAAALALSLGACAFERPTSDVPVSYDFGPPRSAAPREPRIPGIVLIAPARAAAPLDDTAIVYRLLYEDAAQPRAYAMSRWADEPARLLTERIRSRFATVAKGVIAPGFGARSDYTLRIDLADFSQQFETPAASRIALRVRATLLATDGRKVLAQRAFEVERPAEPNAPGAVKGLTDATDAFIEDLVKWSIENARP